MAAKVKSSSANSARDRVLIMLLSIALGFGLGFGIAHVDTNTTDTIKTADPYSEMNHSHYDAYEVSKEDAPKVELVVSEDAKSGYNIKVITTDFIFTPENINGSNIEGEGHAHLYVDDKKIARLYGPYYHWDGSFEGTKEFKVTLNANDHSEYTVNGVAISSAVNVTHDSKSSVHDESHMMDSEESDNHMQ